MAAFVPYHLGTTPSQRYRIEQWRPHLAEAGIEVSLFPFACPELTSLLQRPGHSVRKASLVLAACARSTRSAIRLPPGTPLLVHRAAWLAGPPLLERTLRRRGHRLVYDFDDAIFRLDAGPGNRALAWLKMPGKTATLCRISDHVVVGNSYLAEWASRYNPNVTVVPSSIDTDRYQPRSRPKPTGRLVVGWMGSGTSQAYLEAFQPMLREFLRTGLFELRVISDRPPRLGDVPSTWRPWTAAGEEGEVADFDIGIMPLLNDEWALGKCAMKALQYMAAGVPTVASAVGANREVIEHGTNGLLAATTEEWLFCLTALARDPDLRERIGQSGRATVVNGYSMRTSARKLEAVLNELLAPSTANPERRAPIH
jgi:glycosyltransferase involved in cell wall biosynthesis